MKTYKTNCIRCWKNIRVLFDPPIKQINCIEVECCNGESKIKASVLVVDDDVNIISVITKFLEKFGCEVTTANSSEQALEQINSKKIFDLVICDLFLGEDDGLQLLYDIRKQRPSIKTILTSGSLLSEKEIHLINVNDFLAKPFELSELKGTVQKILEI